MNRTLDVLGVYLLPLCCFVADYAADYLGTRLYPLTLWTSGAAGMAAFAVSERAAASPKAANIVAGALILSATGARLIAVPLSFVGIFGLLAGLLGTGRPVFAFALLAFVPIMTAARLAKRAGTLLRTTPWSAGFLAVGAGAILLPTGLVFLVEVLGDERREADLLSGERDRVLRALSPDSWYGPRDIVQRPADVAWDICLNLSALPLHDPAVESAARKALAREERGAPPDKTVREYCGGTSRSGNDE